MAGLEGIDASSMEIVDALGASRWTYDHEDRIVRPLVRHADRIPIATMEDGDRVVARARFGMPAGPRLITNARDDRLLTARSWTSLFAASRCMTAVSYVVERDRKTDTTYRIQRRDGQMIVAPGLCAVRHYRFTSTGNEYDELGHVQITTDANRFIGQIHDRFVCDLDTPAARDAWMLGEGGQRHLDLLRPAADDVYEMVPISGAVWKRGPDTPPDVARPRGQPVVWTGGTEQSGLDAFG